MIEAKTGDASLPTNKRPKTRERQVKSSSSGKRIAARAGPEPTTTKPKRKANT